MLSLEEAFNTVIDLARQNIIDERDNEDEHIRQTDCVNIIDEFKDHSFKIHPNYMKMIEEEMNADKQLSEHERRQYLKHDDDLDGCG